MNVADVSVVSDVSDVSCMCAGQKVQLYRLCPMYQVYRAQVPRTRASRRPSPKTQRGAMPEQAGTMDSVTFFQGARKGHGLTGRPQGGSLTGRPQGDAPTLLRAASPARPMKSGGAIRCFSHHFSSFKREYMVGGMVCVVSSGDMWLER